MSTPGDRLGNRLPECDPTDAGALEAWYGNYSFFDHWRKIVLANCEEMTRAEYALREEKITETRITTLARLHPSYIDFLREHLDGRRLREQNVIDSNQYSSPVR